MQSHMVRVTDLIGGQVGISDDDGQRVYATIEPCIRKRSPIVVSFENITTLVPLFLNTAIGQLYGTYEESVINDNLIIEGMSRDDLALLEHVREHAKRYYANREGYDLAWAMNDKQKNKAISCGIC